MFLENCAADGFVKTGREGRLFHSGGRGMLRVRQDTGCFFSPVKSILIQTGAFIALNEDRRVSFFH